MNRKHRKLLFIRSKNYMHKRGYVEPKWSLVNHKWPTKWVNNSNMDALGIIEDAWVIDMRRR